MNRQQQIAEALKPWLSAWPHSGHARDDTRFHLAVRETYQRVRGRIEEAEFAAAIVAFAPKSAADAQLLEYAARASHIIDYLVDVEDKR